MDLGLRGKIALVSASSKGLGRAIAEELAAEGANLIMCARGEDALRQTADSIRKSAGVTIKLNVVLQARVLREQDPGFCCALPIAYETSLTL